jgi:uncharacterized protein
MTTLPHERAVRLDSYLARISVTGYSFLTSTQRWPDMQAFPLRLSPGDDLRVTLEETTRRHGWSAAFVIQGIGSLSVAQLRFAGVDAPDELRGDLEILTLAGSLSGDGAHLHMSVADAQGRVRGGHVAQGCVVRTTAELLIVVLPAHRFSREIDSGTGYLELLIRSGES